MKRLPPLLLASGLILWPATAQSSPLVLKCKLTDSSTKTGTYRDVDQVIVDVNVPSVELRAAQTRASGDQYSWVFSNSGRDTLSAYSIGGNVILAGLRDVSANAFSLDTRGNFVFTYTIPGVGVESFEWSCEK